MAINQNVITLVIAMYVMLWIAKTSFNRSFNSIEQFFGAIAGPIAYGLALWFVIMRFAPGWIQTTRSDLTTGEWQPILQEFKTGINTSGGGNNSLFDQQLAPEETSSRDTIAPRGNTTVTNPQTGETTVATTPVPRAEYVTEELVQQVTNSYTVVSGDTLNSIARRMGSTVANIKSENGMTGDAIHVGQTIQIPTDETITVTRVVESTQPIPESTPEPTKQIESQQSIDDAANIQAIATFMSALDEYRRNGNLEGARRIYHDAAKIDPASSDVINLAIEIDNIEQGRAVISSFGELRSCNENGNRSALETVGGVCFVNEGRRNEIMKQLSGFTVSYLEREEGDFIVQAHNEIAHLMIVDEGFYNGFRFTLPASFVKGIVEVGGRVTLP